MEVEGSQPRYMQRRTVKMLQRSHARSSGAASSQRETRHKMWNYQGTCLAPLARQGIGSPEPVSSGHTDIGHGGRLPPSAHARVISKVLCGSSAFQEWVQ